MEERMNALMEGNRKKENGTGAVRWAACASLGGIALLAASMLQVQPALAGERSQPATAAPAVSQAPAVTDDASPRLIGGELPREQLRAARRSLAKAGAAATTDEDRRKIATATDVLLTAENELDAASGSSHRSSDADDRIERMPRLEVHFSNVQPFDSNKFRAQVDGFRIQMEERREAMTKQIMLQIDSPEFRARLDEQRQQAEKLRAKVNTPEFRANIERQREQAEKIRAQMNTPEFRAQIERAQTIGKQRVQVQVERALRERAAAMEQADAASSLMARVEAAPAPAHPVAVDQAKPLPVEARVMAGNIVNKVTPVYPPEAKEKKIQGEVVLHAIISEAGIIEALSVVSSPDKGMSESALAAVHQWVYRPYLLNGNPVAVDTTITVHYLLVP